MQKPKPKPMYPGSLVRTVDMSVLLTVHNCGTKSCTEQLRYSWLSFWRAIYAVV